MEATYEYKVVKVPRSKRNQTRVLSKYGADGWEVVKIQDLWQGHVNVTLRRTITEQPAKPANPVVGGLFGIIGTAFARMDESNTRARQERARAKSLKGTK